MALTRRGVLNLGLAGSTALALFPGAALGQQVRGPFGLDLPAGIDLPDQLLELLPQGALDLLDTVETIIALEREAENLNLPRSALELANGGTLPTSIDDLYRAALPRLVALIDRATGARTDRGLGDRAAALLAALHGEERQVPEFFQPHQDANATDLPGRFSFLTRALRLQEIVTPVEPVIFSASPMVQDVPAAPEPQPEPAVSEPSLGPVSPPSRATGFAELADEYVAYFDSLVVRPERRDDADWCVTMLRESRRRYDAVSAQTGVPWYFVGATHALEASFNFRGHLHNGDFPLSQRTRQVPANRPQVWLPPSDWESSAVDALRMMGFAGREDWSLARTLHRLEAYNGFGYRRRQVPTPYLWSFSTHYDRGKFVADGRWSTTARSQQCGAAVMLKLLSEAGEISLG